MNQEYYTVAEISQMLKVNRKTIYGWVSLRKFPYCKVNGYSVRIPKDTFDDWLEDQMERRES